MGKPKRLASVIAAAEAAGWTYDEDNSGHPRLSPPRGLPDPRRPGHLAAPATFGKTPSDHRGDANTIAYLRRCGVDIPRKGQGKGR